MKKGYYAYKGLFIWSLLRHKIYIPVFIIVQTVLSLAIIYGFSYITNSSDRLSQSYLCTGAITISLLAVACVLGPQIVSEAKQNGIFRYQKTLPISQVSILFSDLLIWLGVAIPGIMAGLLVSSLNFRFAIYLDFIGLGSLLFVLTALILLGFAIAYVLPANLVALLTQVIMMGGLLFSPIIYSSDRLPDWLNTISTFFPFVSVSRIIRFSLFHLSDFIWQDYVIVLCWGLLAFLIGAYSLTKKE